MGLSSLGKNILIAMQRLFLLLILFPCFTHAQLIDSKAISSASATANVEKLSISYTLGEAISGSAQAGEIWLSQGFNLPFESIATSNADAISQQFTLYPNPAKEVIHLQLEDADRISAVVWTMDGKEIQRFPLTPLPQRLHVFRLDSFSPGQYILRITSSQGYGQFFYIRKI